MSTLPIIPRLEMKEIRKRFGATIALDGVSIAVMPLSRAIVSTIA